MKLLLSLRRVLPLASCLALAMACGGSVDPTSTGSASVGVPSAVSPEVGMQGSAGSSLGVPAAVGSTPPGASNPVAPEVSPPGGSVAPQVPGMPPVVNLTPAHVSCEAAAPRRVRRLSQREYFNVVSDLLGPGVVQAIENNLPIEPRSAGFDNQDASLRVGSAFQSALSELVGKLVEQVNVAELAPCQVDPNACLLEFARAFARRAYGRSATPDEVNRLAMAASTAEDYETRVRLVIEVVLQSPNTLYATELGPPGGAPSGPTVELTQHERASQLSLLLTGSRPDEALLTAAEEGRLATPGDMSREAARLIQTPRAKEQMRVFVMGWLDQGTVSDAPKNPDVFPEFTPALAEAMEAQTRAFIQEQIEGKGTFEALLTENPSQIPEALEPIYGEEITPIGLDPMRRLGVLSLPGVLTYHAADQHSGPIERGLLVRGQLLCTQAPPPPPTVIDLTAQNPIDATDATLTTRQKYAMHVEEPSCAGCHALFDPIGFGFEEMDGLGRFRTTENGLPVDSSGQLAGTDVDGPFEGVAELSTMLARSNDAKRCFVQHFFRFAASRTPESKDRCALDSLGQRFLAGSGSIEALFLDFVADPGFVTRKEDRL